MHDLDIFPTAKDVACRKKYVQNDLFHQNKKYNQPFLHTLSQTFGCTKGFTF